MEKDVTLPPAGPRRERVLQVQVDHREWSFEPGHLVGKRSEVVLACNVLNAMTDMGRPDSYAISR